MTSGPGRRARSSAALTLPSRRRTTSTGVRAAYPRTSAPTRRNGLAANPGWRIVPGFKKTPLRKKEGVGRSATQSECCDRPTFQ